MAVKSFVLFYGKDETFMKTFAVEVEDIGIESL